MYLLLKLFLSLLFSFSFAKSFEVKKEVGSTVFKAIALGLKFDGKAMGPYGSIQVENKVTGEVFVDLDNLDTGIGLRNTHMKDNYLETQKFPNAKLIIEDVKDFNLNSDVENYSFTGRLVVRNIEKPIEEGQLKLKKTTSGYEVQTNFKTRISYFSIPIPKYAGLALKDDINIQVSTLVMETK